jgi:hypothetical protein
MILLKRKSPAVLKDEAFHERDFNVLVGGTCRKDQSLNFFRRTRSKAYNCGNGQLFERLVQQVGQTIATQCNLSFRYLSCGRFVVPGQQD